MQFLKKCSALVAVILLVGLSACAHGHHNLTNNYHDGHLGTYKNHNN